MWVCAPVFARQAASVRVVTTAAVVRVVLASARRLPHFAPFLAVPINVLPTVVQMCVETTVVEVLAESVHPPSHIASTVHALLSVHPTVPVRIVGQMDVVRPAECV